MSDLSLYSIYVAYRAWKDHERATIRIIVDSLDTADDQTRWMYVLVDGSI